jgi:peptidyl-prolyl cis-trans isomerase C
MIRRCMVPGAALVALLFLMGSARPAQQDVKSVPAPPAVVSNDVVIKVLGESVTERQVTDTVNQILAQLSRAQQVTPDQVKQKDTLYFKEALDTIVGTILLKNEAKEKSMVVETSKIDANLKTMKGQFPDETKFQEALKTQGLTEETLRTSIETNLLCQQMIDLITKDVPPASDADILKFYNENPKYFPSPEQVHAAEIFMKVDKAATPEQKAEIRKKMEAIKTDIESKKLTFADAATKNSEDTPSAQKGGDLGTFKRGDMIKVLEDAVFSAQPGTLTPIIESEFGFHLFNVIEHKPVGVAPLDDTYKGRIKNYIENLAKQDVTRKHLDALKAKTKVEIVMSEVDWNKRHAAK